MLQIEFATKQSPGGDTILKIDCTWTLRTSTTEKSSHFLTYKLKLDKKFVLRLKFSYNSPDLNPVDYRIWSVMQHRVYRKKVQDVAELRGRLIEVWAGMEQTIIDDAIDQWRRRLRACVGAKGGHFEHSF